MNHFTHQYLTLFDVKIARSDHDLKKVHQLRYEVYVKERQWEPENADHLEIDTYDSDAHHLLMTFKPFNMALGTARIILPDKNKLHNSYPMQSVCFHSNFMDRQWVASHPEFSRFAISKAARESCLNYTSKYFPNLETQYFFARALSFGLIAKMTHHLRIHHYEGVCAILERPLVRLLNANGLAVHKLGKPVEYHGLRQPCYFEVKNLTELISKPEGDLAQLIYYLCNQPVISTDTKMSHKDAWFNELV